MSYQLPDNRQLSFRTADDSFDGVQPPQPSRTTRDLVNLNKLFPRLSIRAKLLIALVGVAVVPLVAVSTWGVRTTVGQIRANAQAAVEHDLHLAEAQVARSIETARSHVQFLADAALASMLLGSIDPENPDVIRAARAVIATEPMLVQVKVVDASGEVLQVIRGEQVVPDTDPSRADGTFYAWRARSLAPREFALLPIELAAPAADSDGLAPLAAAAVIFPVHDAHGALAGAVVGETHAARLFADLELASPNYQGITGLVDREGLFLYHSVRKRNWASLLARGERLGVRTDYAPEIANAILSGRTGTSIIPRYGIVSYRPLRLGGSLAPSLTLYRSLPLAPLTTPVSRFIRLVLVGGALLLGLVILVAFIAADQFTLPIYRLRSAAHRLAVGEEVEPPRVETNDELEELAEDFASMAATLSQHRRDREEVLAERTRALEATHAELADLLRHSADAIIGVDRNAVIRVWNDGAERLFGHAPADALGQDLHALIGPAGDDGAHERAYLQEQLDTRGAVVDYRTTRRTAAGLEIPVTLTKTLLRSANGDVLGMSVIVRDSRMREQLEDQMRRSERLAAMHVMAAGLAHEINNPLAILHNRIELMQRDASDAGAPAAWTADLDALAQHVTRLGELTTGLLRFARDEGGTGPVQVDATAQRLVALLAPTFVSRRLTLAVELAGAPAIVRGNEKALETVLVNLLLNAADATPGGGRVHLLVRGGEDEVELIVTDTGPGIPAPHRERIFEPFFTTKEAGRGTGLGLSVCRSIVERHGGGIRVGDAPGGGSCFTVSLPPAISEPLATNDQCTAAISS